MIKMTLTSLAVACALGTMACTPATQQNGQPQPGYANDKAGGGNTNAPGYSKPAGN